MTAMDLLLEPTPLQVADALSRARNLLLLNGWTQGTAFRRTDGQDCWCALGALSSVTSTIRVSVDEVVPGEALRDEAHVALIAALPAGFVTVARYNDYLGRTKAEILRLYDTAIAAVWRRVA